MEIWNVRLVFETQETLTTKSSSSFFKPRLKHCYFVVWNRDNVYVMTISLPILGCRTCLLMIDFPTKLFSHFQTSFQGFLHAFIFTPSLFWWEENAVSIIGFLLMGVSCLLLNECLEWRVLYGIALKSSACFVQEPEGFLLFNGKYCCNCRKLIIFCWIVDFVVRENYKKLMNFWELWTHHRSVQKAPPPIFFENRY